LRKEGGDAKPWLWSGSFVVLRVHQENCTVSTVLHTVGWLLSQHRQGAKSLSAPSHGYLKVSDSRVKFMRVCICKLLVAMRVSAESECSTVSIELTAGFRVSAGARMHFAAPQQPQAFDNQGHTCSPLVGAQSLHRVPTKSLNFDGKLET
jgi:hypothetical protein